MHKSEPPKYDWIDADSMERVKHGQLIAIVGSSGSGKSVLGRSLCKMELQTDVSESLGEAKLIDVMNGDVAKDVFAVGLKSIPSWAQSLNHLSCGELYRALLALRIQPDMFVDEFTSNLDRLCAAACALGLRKLILLKNFQRVCVATCHRDILPFLKPDIVIDCDAKVVSFNYAFPIPKVTVVEGKSRMEHQPYMGQLNTADIVIVHKKSQRSQWEHYRKHHYLTKELHKAAQCHEFFWNGIAVAFVATLPLVGKIPNARRESRLVVLPFAQGLGIGPCCSEFVAASITQNGQRYFTKTSHEALGTYRNKAVSKWRPTSSNGKKNSSRGKMTHLHNAQRTQPCLCHEFIN